jgi:hypothetical protein
MFGVVTVGLLPAGLLAAGVAAGVCQRVRRRRQLEAVGRAALVEARLAHVLTPKAGEERRLETGEPA